MIPYLLALLFCMMLQLEFTGVDASLPRSTAFDATQPFRVHLSQAGNGNLQKQLCNSEFQTSLLLILQQSLRAVLSSIAEISFGGCSTTARDSSATFS